MASEVTEDSPGELEGRAERSTQAGQAWCLWRKVLEGGRGVSSGFQTPSQAPNPGSWPWGGSGRERAGDGVGELSLACLLTFWMALSKSECRRAAHLFLPSSRPAFMFPSILHGIVCLI